MQAFMYVSMYYFMLNKVKKIRFALWVAYKFTLYLSICQSNESFTIYNSNFNAPCSKNKKHVLFDSLIGKLLFLQYYIHTL